ncbi:RidA family protein [Paenibacillus spongiae]|uniref:RidA family protein n=1 Tax=Paenibacillus spongiae TaxID=2909671 RepID=A0ABY5SA36_9BACL|nr:RidA family protein [Paenibacillus spongiae]UVI29650.1 RidA family protein [Paenibacillus spongiae]
MHKPNTSEVPTGLPFSPGIETESALYVSGQGGIDPVTGQIVGPDIESQTVTTMENIRSVLLSYNMDLKDVVKVNVYLSDRHLYQEFNEIYARFFQAPYPARTTIYCNLNYDLLVEIDAIAVPGRK